MIRMSDVIHSGSREIVAAAICGESVKRTIVRRGRLAPSIEMHDASGRGVWGHALSVRLAGHLGLLVDRRVLPSDLGRHSRADDRGIRPTCERSPSPAIRRRPVRWNIQVIDDPRFPDSRRTVGEAVTAGRRGGPMAGSS